MKNCVDTIKEWIDAVKSKIVDIELVYGINRRLNYHVVIVKPSPVYNNEEYMKLEEEFDEKFYSMFPDEDLLITDDDSIMDITDPIVAKSRHYMDCEFTGEKYEFRNSNRFNITSHENSYALAA
jgi:hypothetical protein